MKIQQYCCRLNHQLKILVKLFLIIAIINAAESKFIFQSDQSSMTQQSIIRDPLVQVQGTSKHFNIQQYDLTHLKFVEIGKNKRNTYEKFIRKYKKITNCLIKNQIVPHQTAMIHSGIQMNFNSKKRVWQFSRVFVVYSDKNQLNKVLKYLEPFKLATLKQRIVMGYLNQKLLAIKAFTDAKTKLQKFLKKKLNSKLEIIYVMDIEIKGKKFINEEDIQSQIKKQNNYSNSQNQIFITKSESKGKDKKQNYDSQLIDQDAVMKVLFKIGQKIQQNIEIPTQNQQQKSDDSGGQILDQDLEPSPQGQIEEQL